MSKVLSEMDAVAEGLADYSDSLWDSIETGVVAIIASQEPAWARQAAREWAEFDDTDWGYLDWKWERDNAIAEREFDAEMLRMDDDGGPVTRDWWSYRWGLEE